MVFFFFTTLFFCFVLIPVYSMKIRRLFMTIYSLQEKWGSFETKREDQNKFKYKRTCTR